MKHNLFFPIAAMITSSFMLQPFAYNFITVNSETGRNGIKPEKTTAVYQKPKGKASTTSEYVISGVKSAVRLKIALLMRKAKRSSAAY